MLLLAFLIYKQILCIHGVVYRITWQAEPVYSSSNPHCEPTVDSATTVV